MTRRTIHRLLVFSVYLLLLLATGIAVLAYLVSPLHDPSFVPMGPNAGATIDWLRPEKYWMVLIYTFSIALPTNVTVLAWLWLRSKNRRLTIDRDLESLLIEVVGLAGLWIIMAYGTWMASLSFLLQQWIID